MSRSLLTACLCLIFHEATPSTDIVDRVWAQEQPVLDFGKAKLIGTVLEGERITSIALSGDGDLLAIDSRHDRGPRIRDVPRNQRLGRRVPHVEQRSCQMKFASDGTLLAIGLRDGGVVLWDTRRRVIAHHWRAHKKPVRSMQFARKDDVLATRSDDDSVKLWNISHEPVELATLSDNDAKRDVWSMAVDESMRRVVIFGMVNQGKLGGSDGQLTVIDTSSKRGRVTTAFSHGAPVLFVFEDDSNIIVVTEGGEIFRWSIEREKVEKIATVPARIESADYCAQAKLVAFGTRRHIRFWDARREVLLDDKLQVENGPPKFGDVFQRVRHVRISHDARTIVGGNERGIIKTWHIEP